ATTLLCTSMRVRTRALPTLSELGSGPGAVLGSFLIESIFVAVLGGLAGCVLSLPMNGITSGTTNFQSFSETTFQFHITPEILVQALAFSAVLGLVGGFFPALQASRQTLSRALRA